jgi:hypothetical protein
MAIPDSVPKTAEGHLKYLKDQVDRANKHWTHYGWATSNAYATAYNNQLTQLRQVKDAIEARLEFEHDFVSFTLSLLTVGVAGGAAGLVARSMFDKSTKTGEAMIDAMKQVLQRAQKAASDEDIAAISPKATVAADAFAPAGVTPEEYTTSLQEGISYYSALLSDILNAIEYDSGPQKVRFGEDTVSLKTSGLKLAADDARRLTEAILNSTYVRDAPETSVKSADLIPKAALALWIGWAYGRDVKYWRKAKTEYYINNRSYDEQFDWEPVRLRLISLGLPSSAVTVTGTEYLWLNDTRPKTGLDMWGFLNWVASPASTTLLFAGLPKDAKGFEMVRSQMDRMQLTLAGWIRQPAPPPSRPMCPVPSDAPDPLSALLRQSVGR